MGKKTRLKEQQAQLLEAEVRSLLVAGPKTPKKEPDPLIKTFEPYQEHFARAPETFVLRTRSAHREKQLLEMARHLFGVYRAPRILERVWGDYEPKYVERAMPRRGYYYEVDNRIQRVALNTNLVRIDFRAWYICVALGGSLYKQHAKGFLTKKETHTFLSASENLSIPQALVWAVARCSGADNGDALRLARTKISDRTLDSFWLDTVRYFCLEGNTPKSVEQVNDLLDYLDHRRQEDNNFRLLGSGHSLAAMLRRMEQWHRSLARAKDMAGLSWEGVELEDHRIEVPNKNFPDLMDVWTFHQITTGKELAEEGTAMRHCVYSYKHKCLTQTCSIWSVQRIDAMGRTERKLTVELDANFTIVQKRGLANRMPRAEEEAMLRRWAQETGIRNSWLY